MDENLARAAAHWNSVTADSRPRRTRWWESQTILRHINALVCGEAIPGMHAGFHRLIAEARRDRPIRKAVSVGCGAGQKEMSLIQSGIVQEFHLYEISIERIRRGRERARSLGIADRVHFHEADAFEACHGGDYDLVYWNNALHHMPDARAAVQWSKARLLPDGLFAMDDFIGPSRFQWTDTALSFARRFRESLPARFLADPMEPTRKLPPPVRPTIESMIKIDPSEAADSASILPAIHEVFHAPRVIFTGGVIYHTGLNDVLANMAEDARQLKAALLLDHALAIAGENQYAVALAGTGSQGTTP